MTSMSRRSVLGTTLGLAAAGTLGRPYIANAQAKTATVWVNQGFIPQEDAACNKLIDRLHEGERQQDRPQHHAVHGDEPEDHLRTDQRRCPRSHLRGCPGEYPAAERLGRQNRGRDRRCRAL